MNILIASGPFWPGIGGLETVTRLLSTALVELGHQVTVVTRQLGRGGEDWGFRLLRQPCPGALLGAYRGADAVLLQGPTLRLGWPLLCLGHRCASILHHATPAPVGAARAGLRHRLALRTGHFSVSHALARALPWPVKAVVPNPYDARTFRTADGIARSGEVLFVGRLIPEKGVHLLIEAVGRLRDSNRPIVATVVGDGPDHPRLEALTVARGLEPHVRLVGQRSGTGLAHLFQQHQLLAAPSISFEAFGLVALEAIACGCAVVGSDVGGLPEAIGTCGALVAPGDVVALAEMLWHLLQSPDQLHRFRAGAENHLASHQPHAVARKYLDLLLSPDRRNPEHVGQDPPERDPCPCALS